MLPIFWDSGVDKTRVKPSGRVLTSAPLFQCCERDFLARTFAWPTITKSTHICRFNFFFQTVVYQWKAGDFIDLSVYNVLISADDLWETHRDWLFPIRNKNSKTRSRSDIQASHKLYQNLKTTVIYVHISNIPFVFLINV